MDVEHYTKHNFNRSKTVMKACSEMLAANKQATRSNGDDKVCEKMNASSKLRFTPLHK